MKKDSFTFSDKLKKSKTLPLSKRIPSRIGGEVKAKRTLFERAQRDLPFIIVAALALLLLPFLSRESVDDIPSVVWPGNGEEEIDITQRPISQTDSDSTFAGFNDPLKWISTASGRDSMRNAIDTPSEYDTDASESSSGSSSGYSYGSKSQEEDYYSSSKTPATGKYGKTVRRSVRNSINRVPTQIGSLRASSLPGARSGQGVTHTLATGAKAKGPTGQSNLSGVRPVALQPLSAKGGRDLTGGDALYAEAARSIGAFNKPGAKQALLEAQLKDVDGQPLGETKGGPGADPTRPGVGGNLANNWHHSPLKPWWWDMMNDRAQKRWMLWHYNWEEMLSKNLINWTSGLMSCLVVGDAGGKVDKFLGDYRGEDDQICLNAEGQELMISYNSYTDKAKVQGGKEGSSSSVQQGNWFDECYKLKGTPTFDKHSGYKSPLDVRLRCLGIKLSYLKEKTQLKRKTICNGMYSDPMYITIEATRNGKAKVNKVKATGYYIVDKKGCVVDIQQATYGKNTLPEYSDEEIKQLDKVVVFRIGTTNLTDDDIYLSSGQREDLDSANKNADEDKQKAREKARKDLKDASSDARETRKQLREKLKEAKDQKEKEKIRKQLEELETSTKEEKKEIRAEREQEISDAEVNNIIELAQYNIKNSKYKGCYTEKQLHDTLKPIGKWRTQYNAKRYLNELATCPVPSNRFTGTKVSPARINPEESTASFDGLTCDDRVVYIDQSNTTHAISATIKNPGPRTVAVVLEYVQGGATVSTDYMDGKIPERTGYLVKEVIDFSKENSWRTRTETKKDKDGNEYQVASYAADFVVGLSSTIKDDTGAMDDSHGTNNLPGARAGKGYVIWITTDDMDAELIGRNAFVKDKSDINALLKLSSKKGYKSAMCEYRWGCESSSCSAANLNNYFCYDDDGNSQNGPFYRAMRVGNYILKKDPPTTVDKSMLTSAPVRCDPLCVFLDNTYGVLPSNEEPYDPLPGVRLTRADLAGAYVDTDCPHCNEDVKPEPKRGTGKICYELIGGRQVPYPCIKIENSRVPNRNPLYIKSDIIPVQPEDEMEEITPICYKKAIALGNIYVREPDGTGKVQVKPDDKIVEMLLTKTPEEQEKLCPYCDGQDKKPEPDPIVRLDKDTIIDFTTPCEVKLQGDYFKNASYIFKPGQVDKMAAHLDRIYSHLQKCGDITIEGHASKAMTVGKEDGFTPEEAKERNNIRLSFDRGISAAEIVRPVWNSKGKTVSVDLSNNNPSNNYTGESSNTEEQSLPKHRNSISPAEVPGADVTFIITGVGSEYATAPARPKANGTAAEKAAWRKAEMGDRKVILRGYPQD